MPGALDLVGQRFERLVVIGREENYKSGKTRWLCKCDCGKTLVVIGDNLRRKSTKSCGCLKRENTLKRITKHGMKHTRIYHIWKSMKERCETQSCSVWKRYGGRGIKVCDEWQTFEPFREWALSNGYTDELTLDRIDNYKGYSPDNCRWATYKQQANNKRVNRFIQYNGETHTLAEWADIVGIKYNTLHTRIVKNGWPVEKAFTTPPRRNGK